MTGDNTILTIFQNYFDQTIIGTLFILSLVYCLLTNNKHRKTFLFGILLIVLFVYNDASRMLIGIIGEKETYYRFIWLLPITAIISYAITDILFKHKDKSSKIIIILGICSVFLLHTTYTFPTRESFRFPSTIASEDAIKICEIIADSHGQDTKTPEELMLDKRVAAPSVLEKELRTYDASLSYGISRNAYVYFQNNGYYTNKKKYRKEEVIVRAIEFGLPPEDPQELRTYIDDLKIKYIVTHSQLHMENYMALMNCHPIGYSENYIVYQVY